MRMLKREILFIAIAVGLMVGICTAKVHRYTADFYTIKAEKYMGEEAKIYAFAAAFCDDPLFDKEGYRAIKVDTIYNDKHGGSIMVLVPADEVLTVKDKYSGAEYADAIGLKGILCRTEGEKGKLYIQCGDPSPAEKTQAKEAKKNGVQKEELAYSDDYYELLAEEFIGKKITIEVTSAALDRSDRFDHIPGCKAFIADTPNAKIQNGKLYVVVPDELTSSFSRVFMKRQQKARSLSGYFYKHKTARTSVLFLYCSNEPLDLDAQKPAAKKDYLHELIAIYMDLDEAGKEVLIEHARDLDSPDE